MEMLEVEESKRGHASRDVAFFPRMEKTSH